jgi:hypothetical protein
MSDRMELEDLIERFQAEVNKLRPGARDFNTQWVVVAGMANGIGQQMTFNPHTSAGAPATGAAAPPTTPTTPTTSTGPQLTCPKCGVAHTLALI